MVAVLRDSLSVCEFSTRVPNSVVSFVSTRHADRISADGHARLGSDVDVRLAIHRHLAMMLDFDGLCLLVVEPFGRVLQGGQEPGAVIRLVNVESSTRSGPNSSSVRSGSQPRCSNSM